MGSSSIDKRRNLRSVGRCGAIAMMILAMTASACGSDGQSVDARGTDKTEAPGQDHSTGQGQAPGQSQTTDQAQSTDKSQSSDKGQPDVSTTDGGRSPLSPGPAITDGSLYSQDELVIKVRAGNGDLERQAIKDRDGKISNDDADLGFFLARFDVADFESLLAARDELRANGIDAALDISSDDPRAG